MLSSTFDVPICPEYHVLLWYTPPPGSPLGYSAPPPQAASSYPSGLPQLPLPPHPCPEHPPCQAVTVISGSGTKQGRGLGKAPGHHRIPSITQHRAGSRAGFGGVPGAVDRKRSEQVLPGPPAQSCQGLPAGRSLAFPPLHAAFRLPASSSLTHTLILDLALPPPAGKY